MSWCVPKVADHAHIIADRRRFLALAKCVDVLVYIFGLIFLIWKREKNVFDKAGVSMS